MKAVFLFLFVFFSLKVFGQGNACLTFIPRWKGKEIPVDSVFSIGSDGDSMRVSALRFYIYNIRFESENAAVWSSGNEHFLVDVFEESGASIPIKSSAQLKFDYLSFSIGVDSTLQTTGAQSGVLDPIHGMYWAWQSGYIAWKLEAELAHSAQSKKIQWHVGGFRAPYQAQRTVRLKLTEQLHPIKCGIQLDELLSEIERSPAEVMSPNNTAMLLADRFQTCFKILPR
jgi:hypothetical protein